VQSLANIDLLKVTYWNPTKTVHDVLKQIKDILLLHARLDVDAARNDAVAHPEGAYHPIEDFLIKLALVRFFSCRTLIKGNTATSRRGGGSPANYFKISLIATEQTSPNTSFRVGVLLKIGFISKNFCPPKNRNFARAVKIQNDLVFLPPIVLIHPQIFLRGRP
jgi:hypothetical protein